MSQATPDPVYAAIRAVEDALTAAEANPHREQLAVAMSNADRAFLRTVPTTRAGLTAYVDFYVAQARSAGMTFASSAWPVQAMRVRVRVPKPSGTPFTWRSASSRAQHPAPVRHGSRTEGDAMRWVHGRALLLMRYVYPSLP